MRMALILLVSAAALSWLTWRLDDGAKAPVPAVTAPRSGVGTMPTSPQTPAPRLNLSPPAQAVIAQPPAFFRAASSPSRDAPRPGERFVLLGIAGQPGARIAFLRDEADGSTYSVREGGRVEGWTLDEIDGHCIRLRRSRETQSPCLP